MINNRYATKKIRTIQLNRIKVIIALIFVIGIIMCIAYLSNSKKNKDLNYVDLQQEYIYHFTESK
jgi:hypothetical protein